MSGSRIRAVACASLALAVVGAVAGVHERPGVRVEYDGIEAAYAEAMGTIIVTARRIHANDFGLDMPETIVMSVECGPDASTRLWTDGQDRVTMTLKRPDQLRKPSDSGVFNIYGLCHELGHMAMYRTLKDRPWLSGDAAEGWAHFCGSVVVDQVYAANGKELWPDPYDYRDDGTKRLDAQLAAAKPDKLTATAGLWRQLDTLLGRKRWPALFAAWNDAAGESGDVTPRLKSALTKIARDKDGAEAWWNEFAKLGVERVEASPQRHRTIAADKLSGEPITLKHDDGSSDGKKSIAGGAHGIFFDAPGETRYLKGISIYAARYGTAKPPAEDFTITLCDADYRPITSWRKPYRLFERGDPQWVDIDLPPSAVPRRFAICVDFNPTGTRGVYLHRDDSTSAASVVGHPGKSTKEVKDGNWMIRVKLDSPRAVDSLRP